MKKLQSIETEQYSLEVYECDCGFHIGLDFSYIDQVGEICIRCPNCGKPIISNDMNEIQGSKDKILGVYKELSKLLDEYEEAKCGEDPYKNFEVDLYRMLLRTKYVLELIK